MRFKQVYIIFIVLFSLVLLIPGYSVLIDVGSKFNITEDSIFLNYTNNYLGNITVGCMSSTCNLNVSNSSTTITANYSQDNTLTACQNLVLNVKNTTGSYSDIILSDGLETSVNIAFDYFSCLPGRYYGGLRIQNITNTTENVTINVTVDNPIRTSNIINSTTGLGNLTSKMDGNSTYYHKYYFNQSQITNSTTVLINLSSTRDLDLFLLDSSGNLLTKSVSGTTEEVIYKYLSSNSMYEFRIYGNITNASTTDYSFYIIYSTLNITNSSNTGQQISSIVFGNLNASDERIENITLENERNLSYSDVQEAKEIYYVKRWEINATESGETDNLFLVPGFATKIKVAVNWTDTNQNYTIHLRAPNKTLVGTSLGKYVNANISGVEMEEFVETTAVSKGYWNVSIRNSTTAVNNYTVTAYVWYPVSQWISTNYSSYSNKTLDAFPTANSTKPIQINLTVSNNTIDGNFEGFIKYYSSVGNTIKMPFSLTAKTSSLIVNQTLDSTIIQIDENIKLNTTKVLNITINNTGSYPLAIGMTNSSALFLGSSYVNITEIQYPSSLSANENGIINITLNISTVTTADSKGVYDGWILFNSTDARPYQEFNLTLRVNLTDLLNVDLLDIKSIDDDSWINQTSISEVIKTRFTVKYLNGTEITELNTSNFTSAWLSNVNISHRIPATGSLTITNGTNPIYLGGDYEINLTIPANQVGGIYQVHILANYTRSNPDSFSGELIGDYLYINQSGLYVSILSSPSSLSNSSSGTVNVSISNYGNLQASSAKIKLNKGSLISSISAISNTGSGCTVSSSDTSTGEVTFTLPGYNASDCYVWWNITAGSTAGTTTSYINGTTGVWFGNTSFSTTITVPSGDDSGDGGTSGDGTTTTALTSSLSLKNVPSEIRAQQNSSKSVNVTVKNTGETSLSSVNVYVEGITQSWYTKPSSQDISKNTNKTFTVKFNIPSTAEVKTYSINFIANDTNATDTVSSSLIITPSNQTQEKIIENITNYTTRYEEIYKLLNETKARGGNVSSAEETLKQAKELIDRANAYITTGDYYSAYQLLDQITNLLDVAESDIKQIKKKLDEVSWDILFWIVIGIIIIGAGGFLIYMVLPPKHGYEPEVGYKYAPEAVRGKLKLSILKEKMKSIIEKVKEKLKRKKTETYQYKYAA